MKDYIEHEIKYRSDDPHGAWGSGGNGDAQKSPFVGGVDLSAAVSLLGNRTNVLFTNVEPETLHGGYIVIGGDKSGKVAGVANISNTEFLRMGKHHYQHPAIYFKYLNGGAKVLPTHIEGCTFTQSQAGGIIARATQELHIKRNVFHRTYRSAVWLNPKPTSWSVRGALLTPQANPGSLYRCGKSSDRVTRTRDLT